MRVGHWIGCVVIVATIVGMAGNAVADARWVVAGRLESVDAEARRIEVNGHMLHVGARSVIKLAGDEPGSWADVVEREDEYVSALVRRGVRGAAEVLTIVLEDEIEDGEE
jgi:hypothetical protein